MDWKVRLLLQPVKQERDAGGVRFVPTELHKLELVIKNTKRRQKNIY